MNLGKKIAIFGGAVTAAAAHNADPAAHSTQIAAVVAGVNLPIFAVRQRQAKSPKVIVLGDSLCSGNDACPNLTQNAKGWGQQVARMSNGAIKLRWNAGVPGDTTAQMVARLAADVIARTPDICVVMGGRNDINTSVAVSTTINNLDTIASTCLASSIMPIVCLVPPSSTGAIAALTNLNDSIRLLCQIKGYPLCDTYTPFINTDGTQKGAAGSGAGELFEDSMHFNETGARLAAATILAAAGWSAAMGCSFMPFRGYGYGNLITNSDFAGGVAGSPGTIPTGWYKIGNPTTSYARDAQGINWLTFSSADGSNASLGCNLSGVVTGGAECIIGVRFEGVTSAAALDVNPSVSFTDGSTYKIARLLDGVTAATSGVVQMTTAAIASNTINSFTITVKPGKSCKFATPFVGLL